MWVIVQPSTSLSFQNVIDSKNLLCVCYSFVKAKGSETELQDWFPGHCFYLRAVLNGLSSDVDTFLAKLVILMEINYLIDETNVL